MNEFITTLLGDYTAGYFFGLLMFTYIGIAVAYGIRRIHTPLTVKSAVKWSKVLTNLLLAVTFVRFSKDLILLLPLDVFVGERMSDPFTAFLFGLLIEYISLQIYKFINNPKSITKMGQTKTIALYLIEDLEHDVIQSLDQESINQTASQLVTSDNSFEIVVGADRKTYLIKNNAAAQLLVTMRRSDQTTYQFTTVDFVGQRPVGR